MSASITDTAELPVTVATPVSALEVAPSVITGPSLHVTEDRADRRQLRVERRRARLTRRLVAAAGLAVLAAFLSATIAVLGVVR